METQLKSIVKSVCEYQGFNSLDEIKEVIQSVKDMDSVLHNSYEDSTIECNGVEIRIISITDIFDIYQDTIQEIVEDCYELNLDKMPSFVAFEIDWEETAKNCLVDGYGHTFSRYDGTEYKDNDFYYFRTF